MSSFLARYVSALPRNAEGGSGGAGDGGAAGGAGGAANGGAAAQPWYQGIDAETIGHWDNKGWAKDDPKALASELTKAWKGLERHFGAPADQIIRLPKDANDEAGWKQFNQRLGVPAEPKEYDLAGVKAADGKDIDQGFADTMRAALHKARVAKDAAPEVVKAVVQHLDAKAGAEATEAAARLQAERATLAKDWGSNSEFNRLTAMQGARRAAGSDEAAKELIAGMEKVVGYAKTMEFFRRIGSGTTEDTFVGSQPGGPVTTTAGALARREELMADKAWVDRYLKGGVTERREMDNLNMMITGVAA